MKHKPCQYFVGIRKKYIGNHIYQQNNLFVYIQIGFMAYVEEKVRKYAFKVL